MADYTINITLTEAEETAIQNMAAKGAKSVEQIFQEFWDGYETQTGAVKAQVLQWIHDDVKAEIETMSDAEALAKLKA